MRFGGWVARGRRAGLRRLAVVLLVLLQCELAAAYLHYRRSIDKDSLALGWAARRLVARAADWIGRCPDARPDPRVLSTTGGRAWRAALERRYADEFSAFAQTVAATGAHLVVLYIPMHASPLADGPGFFGALAAARGVPFVDVSPAFRPFSADDLYLLPGDPHLSRFAHQLIARTLAPTLAGLVGYRSHAPRGADTQVLGPYPPEVDELTATLGDRPYRLRTNRQGFRMDDPLDRDAQRVLILGDSFTFGAHLPAADTFPALIGRTLGGTTIINAGVPGATITDERALFVSRTARVGADLVVLQVLDNDLWDLPGAGH